MPPALWWMMSGASLSPTATSSHQVHGRHRTHFITVCLTSAATWHGDINVLFVPHTHAAGPTTCEAVVLNREELPVWPLYYDPVRPCVWC
jgi:hypothetical protein